MEVRARKPTARGSSAAWVATVVIVKVEVGLLLFRNVTEVGDELQVGAGAGPCTVHVNAIGLVNERAADIVKPDAWIRDCRCH
jgi:hypothetical protein